MNDDITTPVQQAAEDPAQQYALRDMEDFTDPLASATAQDDAAPEPAGDALPPGEGEEASATTAAEDSRTEDTPAAEAKPAETGDGFDDAAIRLAAEYGMNADEARRFGNPDAMKVALTALDRRYADLGRRALTPPAQQQVAQADPTAQGASQQPAQQQAATPPQPAVPPTAAVSPAPAAGEFKLQMEGWDPEVAKTFESLHSYHDQRYQRLQSQFEAAITQVAQQLEGNRRYAEVQVLDRVLTGLGAEYADLVGEGDSLEMDPESPQGKQRTEIWQQAHALATGYRVDGMNVPWPKVVRRAAHLVLADKTNEIARKKVAQDVEAANNRSVPPPSHRRSKTAGGEEAAMERWEQFTRENDMGD
jgi:hypothetical protein